MKITITSILLALLFSSCDKMLLDEEAPNNPQENFKSMWYEFDAKYGLFNIKNIDWDSVYHVYNAELDVNSSTDKLYSVLTQMLKGLNDNHVALVPTDPNYAFFQSGILGTIDTISDFSLEVVKSNYLMNAQFEDPFFTYGKLPNNIGYIHIEGFSDLPRFLEDPMNTIMKELKGTNGIIIDVRGGYGGEDIAGQFIAGHFTANTVPYMKTRVKSGAGINDFTSFESWGVRPEGDFQYLNPVVVLTHRFTISARETFCLAMKVQPQVTFMGDTTSGAFSNQINRELPNGWGYSLSIGEWLDADNISYEGIGLAPDIVIQNEKHEILSGIDKALEAAIEELN